MYKLLLDNSMSNLNGKWYNKLGSYMQLAVDDSGGITGIYNTGVGHASGDYTLSGRTDVIGQEVSGNVGFVVSWRNSHGNSDSVTAWSGQLQVIDGVPTITTTWLLTDETSPGNNWKSTLVGKNIFLKNQIGSVVSDPIEQLPHPKET